MQALYLTQLLTSPLVFSVLGLQLLCMHACMHAEKPLCLLLQN